MALPRAFPSITLTG
jgi:hypothetical protein